MSQQSGDPVADLIRVNTVVQAVVGNGNQLVNSGDNQGELQRPDLLQSTPPPRAASGSWCEKATDARVFHEDKGPVCSDGSCESQW